MIETIHQNSFLLSQILISIAILFDILSFQFKARKKILLCLVIAGIFISTHFLLLGNITASLLMAVAVIRYASSYFYASTKLCSLFLIISLAVMISTFSGILSILSFLGSSFQTMGAFSKNDKRLRELMLIGTSIWLIHNFMAGSPGAVIMEIIFISSNIIGYYRYYILKSPIKN